jgi:RNA polymerase sigma-70 factor, ECF subfamily
MSEPGHFHDEVQWVRAVLRGDQSAYALLVERYQARLFRRAWAMVEDPDLAADLVQEAFIRAYSSLDRARPDRFGAWVHRILRNVCLDELRSPRQRTDALPPAVAGPDDPAQDLERLELGSALDSALASLGPTLREAFVLKHVEGLSYQEMSELTGVAEGALKMRVKRAREALRQALSAVENDFAM